MMLRLAFYVLAVIMQPSSVEGAEIQIFGVEKPVPQYSFAEMSVKLETGDQVQWNVFPEPVKLVEENGKCYVSGPPGTKYSVFVTVVNFKTTRFDRGRGTITMSGTPDPLPEPLDPEVVNLLTELKGAYKFDLAVEKPLVPNLGRVYTAGISLAEKAETWGGLFEEMAKEAEKEKLAGKLMVTQRAIQAYLRETLPWKGASDQKIDAAGRVKAARAFKVIRGALERLN